MADGKTGPAQKLDLTPIFVLLLVIIIAGLGSVRSCEPYGSQPGGGGCGGCAQAPPTQPPNQRPGPPYSTTFKQYTVQVGSFATREQANTMATDLRSKNINNFILQIGSRWLVCVGKYASEERANRMAESLRNRGIGNPVVLKPRGR
ncbi:MAG: SPOR domain-containing protein [candidate division KSB1 bacterium]|nr:SPOR domain-containing protein [candidate division KSB1 bacterium]MDZ7301607.1 SPOR domain-containing protein [candidate division KSB1 bacterium]MDZ7310977.1 SPOR domain-containing protein [candidate division KSB1 bacterium]